MTEGNKNGEAIKDISEYADGEMINAIAVGDKLEDKDEMKEKEQMRDEQETDEEEDEYKVDDQITNEGLQSKHPVGTKEATSYDANAVHDSKSGDAGRLEEDPKSMNTDDKEEEEPKDSEHDSVKMNSKIPIPDKSVDHDVEVNEKICEKNEKSSVGPHDKQHNNVISVKCEKVSEFNSASINGAILGRSSIDDVENSEATVEENKKKTKTHVGNLKKIRDARTAMESTEQTQTFMFADASEGCESGTDEEQSAFMIDLEKFFREKSMEFKAPKFYGVPVNLLQLWRAVIKLGGYDKVTACKLWRQVGESFNPPKTCTTVSFTFRIFYEKALLEYERHKIAVGELDIPPTIAEPVAMESLVVSIQASGSGRARRDAAARAMQGWHSQRLLGNGEVSDPIIKDKGSIPLRSREKHQKNIVAQKRKRPVVDTAVKGSPSKLIKALSDTAVIDLGPAADWVKISVRTTKDCYEVYALVPGLLREEVRVQSDPAGRLVISGEPEHHDNPWGVTPFKKVISLPSRIDPHQTSAVVTLHGQLFVRAPFEQSV